MGGWGERVCVCACVCVWSTWSAFLEDSLVRDFHYHLRSRAVMSGDSETNIDILQSKTPEQLQRLAEMEEANSQSGNLSDFKC